MSMSELDTIEGEVLPAVRPAAPVTLFRSDDPAEVLRRATEAADILASAVKDRGLVAHIGRTDYPTVEAWTLLGSLLGVFPHCVWTRPLENGWEARVEARTLAGQLVGAAEAQCTRAERSWASRDDYALRSMAQTRATGKALRLPLGFVMSLAGYEATPAEEIIDEKTSRRVNTRTGEVVDAAGPGSGTAASESPSLKDGESPAPTEQSTEPYQPTIDTYVPPVPGPDDIPFESTATPPVEAEFAPPEQEEVVYEPAQMARAALIRRTLGVVVSHGVPLTEEQLFDEIEKKARDGRSVFFGFKGQDFEDLTESQAKKVMDWIEVAATKHREQA